MKVNRNLIMAFRVTPEERTRIEQMATREDRTPSNAIRRIVLSHLEKPSNQLQNTETAR